MQLLVHEYHKAVKMQAIFLLKGQHMVEGVHQKSLSPAYATPQVQASSGDGFTTKQTTKGVIMMIPILQGSGYLIQLTHHSPLGIIRCVALPQHGIFIVLLYTHGEIIIDAEYEMWTTVSVVFNKHY